MGFFSDPAAAPSAMAIPSSSSSNRAPRKLGGGPGIRRCSTIDLGASTVPVDSPLSPEAQARQGRRRTARRTSSSGTAARMGRRRGNGMDSSTTSSIGGSSSMNGSMQEHLEDIEAFLSVIKGAGKKQRNQILRSSLKSKNDTEQDALAADLSSSP